ncbi:hypothetical protein O59_004169 [Cellvibrio sp. BR]|nr:hypothetical protein O59_004169 [Cellvibrio sp. BR]
MLCFLHLLVKRKHSNHTRFHFLALHAHIGSNLQAYGLIKLKK